MDEASCGDLKREITRLDGREDRMDAGNRYQRPHTQHVDFIVAFIRLGLLGTGHLPSVELIGDAVGYQRVCLRCDSLSSYSAACWCWLWGAEQQEDVEEQRRPSVAAWSLSQVRYVADSACAGAVLSKSPPLAPMLCFEAHQPTSLVKAADREGKGRLLCPLGNTASCCTLRPNFVLLYCSADLDFDERLSNGNPWLINIYTHYVRPGSVVSRPPICLSPPAWANGF